jgi:hypothetical protein
MALDTIVAKTVNHSLPGNYVTVTFLAGSPVPPRWWLRNGFIGEYAGAAEKPSG